MSHSPSLTDIYAPISIKSHFNSILPLGLSYISLLFHWLHFYSSLHTPLITLIHSHLYLVIHPLKLSSFSHFSPHHTHEQALTSPGIHFSPLLPHLISHIHLHFSSSHHTGSSLHFLFRLLPISNSSPPSPHQKHPIHQLIASLPLCSIILPSHPQPLQPIPPPQRVPSQCHLVFAHRSARQGVAPGRRVK